MKDKTAELMALNLTLPDWLGPNQKCVGQIVAANWQANEKIELWLGNAGAVELELNGKLLKKIGRPGRPLKNVTITRAGLSI